ncbi:MAG TPA: response regulator transcription factor [Cyclobacteriaceae bacterium]|nr:response regulator transcription factor [Cyclobacteriaceae bacterium]
MQSRIKVTIVDDHSVVRSGLVKILSDEPDMEIVAEANGYTELRKSLTETVPNIILLDISMPGKNGLEILKELKDNNPDIKVLVLSMHPEDRFSVRSIKAGASGYLTKESAPEELVDAIRQVHANGKFITLSLAERLMNSFEKDSNKLPHEKLSDREFQILCLIASGSKIKEIAEKLFLSPATIATYRARVMEKMQLRSNVDLTNYAIRNNLIE